MKLVSGAQYFAGIKRPFFVPQSMLVSAAESLGFSNVQFYSREEKVPPVNPKLDPTYSDEWDEWISADYVGTTKEHDITKRWAWAIRRVKGKPLQPVKGGQSQLEIIASSGPGVGALIIGELLLWAAIVRLRKKK